MSIQKCEQCSQKFEITDADLKFYEKVSPFVQEKKYLIPTQTLCLTCREQLKFSFRNERVLYQRTCDMCSKKMVALYPQESEYTVYCSECWWSDSYNPLELGREFDFEKPFFYQFQDLMKSVPKLAIQNAKSINSDYTNYSAENKNCYLLVGSLGCENCFYGYRIMYSKDVVDSYDMYKCELCYECIESNNLYNAVYCKRCENSSNLLYCENCVGCEHCFASINLKNKKYHIFNKPLSKDEYFEKVKQLKRLTDSSELEELRNKVPHKSLSIINSENCTGDSLLNCRNCIDCYILKNSDACKHMSWGEKNKDCYDAYFTDNCELQYESLNLEKNYHVLFGALVWYCQESFYVNSCFHSNHLFGCTGMKKNSYCILNKQYSKEEYEKLLGKVFDHLKETGELGKFFPSYITPFAYNESVANEYYPLRQDEAEKKGWNWRALSKVIKNVEKIIDAEKLPDNIESVPDRILQWAIRCKNSKRPFRIQKEELKFYRKMDIPIPRLHPDERHRLRMNYVHPRKLWERDCIKCGKSMKTTYAPERPEKVYCETCYLEEVY